LDAGFFKDRVNVTFTVYNKTTSDALIQVQEAPDVCGNNFLNAFGQCQLFQNLGQVNNNGFELGLSGVVVDTKPFRFDMTINGSENNNKLLKLGLPAPIFFNAAIDGNVQQFSEGRALGTFYAVPYTYKDLNHDGILEPNELTLGKNTAYLGGPNPKGEWTLAPEFTFFGIIKLSSTFDRRYGSRTLNFTEEFRCFASFLCSAQYNPHATLQQQAAYLGAQEGTDFGYIENNAFWKWRELAVTLMVPRQWIRRTPFSQLNIQLAERNVATWTRYTGFDPEINFISTGSNFITSDFLTQPAVRYLTMRVNVGL